MINKSSTLEQLNEFYKTLKNRYDELPRVISDSKINSSVFSSIDLSIKSIQELFTAFEINSNYIHVLYEDALKPGNEIEINKVIDENNQIFKFLGNSLREFEQIVSTIELVVDFKDVFKGRTLIINSASEDLIDILAQLTGKSKESLFDAPAPENKKVETGVFQIDSHTFNISNNFFNNLEFKYIPGKDNRAELQIQMRNRKLQTVRDLEFNDVSFVDLIEIIWDLVVKSLNRIEEIIANYEAQQFGEYNFIENNPIITDYVPKRKIIEQAKLNEEAQEEADKVKSIQEEKQKFHNDTISRVMAEEARIADFKKEKPDSVNTLSNKQKAAPPSLISAAKNQFPSTVTLTTNEEKASISFAEQILESSIPRVRFKPKPNDVRVPNLVEPSRVRVEVKPSEFRVHKYEPMVRSRAALLNTLNEFKTSFIKRIKADITMDKIGISLLTNPNIVTLSINVSDQDRSKIDQFLRSCPVKSNSHSYVNNVYTITYEKAAFDSICIKALNIHDDVLDAVREFQSDVRVPNLVEPSRVRVEPKPSDFRIHKYESPKASHAELLNTINEFKAGFIERIKADITMDKIDISLLTSPNMVTLSINASDQDYSKINHFLQSSSIRNNSHNYVNNVYTIIYEKAAFEVICTKILNIHDNVLEAVKELQK